MTETNTGAREGPLSKIIWMIIAAVVTALASLLITYYITTPLAPRAQLTVKSALGGMLFDIMNVDKRLTVKDVWVEFTFDGTNWDDDVIDDVRSADFCKKINEKITTFDAQIIFKCDFLNPDDDRRFTFLYSKNSGNKVQEIRVYITYEGYSSKHNFHRCTIKKEIMPGVHMSGFAEEGGECG